VITNVRIVWFAQLTESFNVSLPWTQIKVIRIRESKYGVAIVLETSDFAGSYVLGFRIENVEQVFEEVSSLFSTFKQKPIYGV
jgi:Bardet-Biedl syndrome 5 protein